MVKAKDLIKQVTQDDMSSNPKDQDEHERVNEAYESLSKKLEAIREGKKIEEDLEGPDEPEDQIDAEGKENKEDDKIKEFEDEDMKDEEEMKTEQDLTEEGESDEPKRTFTKEEDVLDNEENLPEKEVEEEKELDQPKEEPKAEAETVEHDLGDLAQEGKKEEIKDKLEEEVVLIPQLGHSKSTPSEKQAFSWGEKQGSSEEESPSMPSRPERNMFSPRFGAERKRGASKWHVFILLLIGLSVIGGTVYLLKGGFSFAPTPTPTPEPTPEVVLTPTPTPQAIDRSQFKIRVLNGTETSGLAKSVSDKLKGLGYQIERVGNATNSAFLKTVVRFKENQSSLSGQLVKDLSPDFEADVSISLKDSDTSEAEIILGEK